MSLYWSPSARGFFDDAVAAALPADAQPITPEAHEALAIAMNRLGGKSNTGEGGEDRTLTSVIRTETEVVIVTGASRTLFVVGLPPEKEADRFLAEGIIRVHEVRKIEAAKPRGVNDSGTTPTTLKIGAREPRGDLRCSVENTGTLTVHTENDTTSVRGGEDGNVTTGGERCSHCVSRFRFFVSALEHS